MPPPPYPGEEAQGPLVEGAGPLRPWQSQIMTRLAKQDSHTGQKPKESTRKVQKRNVERCEATARDSNGWLGNQEIEMGYG